MLKAIVFFIFLPISGFARDHQVSERFSCAPYDFSVSLRSQFEDSDTPKNRFNLYLNAGYIGQEKASRIPAQLGVGNVDVLYIDGPYSHQCQVEENGIECSIDGGAEGIGVVGKFTHEDPWKTLFWVDKVQLSTERHADQNRVSLSVKTKEGETASAEYLFPCR